MKLVSLAFFVLALLLSLLAPGFALFFPLIFGVLFGGYGILRSLNRDLDPLNDIPNAVRIFLASLGGCLMTIYQVAYIFPSVAILLLLGALYLNDEYQRRAFDSVRRGRRGGSVALLGIDGSGKSSHSVMTGEWLKRRGYTVALMPFHRYIFVERLAALSSTVSAGAPSLSSSSRPRARRRNPLRPLASLIDNLILQFTTSVGCRLEGRVVIYDRFIWSTYIKYRALGYPVKPLSFLYLLPKPTFAIILDVPVEKSLKVIDERVAHIHYPRKVLAAEKEEYLAIARKHKYPVIDSTGPFEQVQRSIESHLEPLFPPVGRDGPRGARTP